MVFCKLSYNTSSEIRPSEEKPLKLKLVGTLNGQEREEELQRSPEMHNFFKCPICSFKTPLRCDLQKHISLYHKQVFVCKDCQAKFDSKESFVLHKRRYHQKQDSLLGSENGQVFNCNNCGSRFDNATIFAAHVKVTCLKGDFMKHSKRKNQFEPHVAAKKGKMTDYELKTDFKIRQVKKECKHCSIVFDGETYMRHILMYKYACKEKDCHNRFTDSISLNFHKKSHLASEGQLEDDDKRNILSKFFGEQSLNLDQSCPKDKYFQAQGPDPSLEKKYSKCTGCGYMVLESHSCRLLQPNHRKSNLLK